MTTVQRFSLRWENFAQNILHSFANLQQNDHLTDVTLSCDGKKIKCHKILLSACSPYFKETLRENECPHPIIILLGVEFVDLEAICKFMYNGQVNVHEDRLPTFLQSAQLLQIKGLTEMNESEKEARRKSIGEGQHCTSFVAPVDNNAELAINEDEGATQSVVAVVGDEPVNNEDQDIGFELNGDDQIGTEISEVSLPEAATPPAAVGMTRRRKVGKRKRIVRLKNNYRQQTNEALLDADGGQVLETVSSSVDNVDEKPERKSLKLVMTSVGDRFLCILCGRHFKNKNVLYNHRSVYHRNNPQLAYGSTEVVRILRDDCKISY